MRPLYIEIILISLISLNVQAQRGRVQIQDGTLVTDKGTLLLGAFSGLGDGWYKTPSRNQVTAIKQLGLNTIHVYAENPYDGSVPDPYPGYNMEELDSMVKWTGEDSLYLVLTMSGWNPSADSFVFNFWRYYADRYKDETHLIFEIENEPGPSENLPPPDYRSFDSIAIEMNRRAYDTIRKYAPETHILLMSPYEFTYNQFMNDIERLGPGIDWSNASIAGHVYTYPAQDYIEPINKLKNEGYAITVTEFHSFLNKYANLACTRVFEQEFVSYIHFIPVNNITDDPSLFKARVESSEVRWTPDFGTWPESITQINYENPYRYWPAIFYDEGVGWINYFEDEIIYGISENDYIAYYYLDFEDAPASFETMCSSDHGSGRIEIHLDSIDGTIVGICPISNTGSLDTYEYFSCDITSSFTGVHHIYLVFKGIAPDWRGIFNVRSWYFNKYELLAPQTPFHGLATSLPGKIEAEEYDVGGQFISFMDLDTANLGSFFREDDVDIDTTRDGGYCIGWTGSGEWLEYTVSCEKDTVIDIQLRVACWEPGDKFNIKLNKQKLATVFLNSIGSYHDWQIITIENITIPAGENQVLRLEFLDGNFNLDKLNFIASDLTGFDELKDKKLITFYPNPAHDYIRINTNEKAVVEIYNLLGQLLIQKQLSANENTISLNALPSGGYVVKIMNSNEVQSEILIID